MARMLPLFGLAALSFALTGCVTSQDKYLALKNENEYLRTQLGQAQSESKSAMAERDILKSQVALQGDGVNNQNGLITNLTQQNQAFAAELADLKRRYEDAMKNVGTGGAALPAPLSNALDAFARENPELVDFDAARGMVKFKTDFTFATGSDSITDKAKQAINRFASILNSDAAKAYELMVAGHTDDTPVVNPATKAKHPDNWYLSSHRAIAVADELIKAHVSPARIAAVGYADQRPVASNGTSQGKAQNRRVEVLILPSTVRSTVAKTTPTAKPAAGTTPRKPAGNNLNKDSSIARPDNGPVLSK